MTHTDENLAETARGKLAGMLERMGMPCEVVVHEEPERITLEIRGADGGLVIGKQGATLDALQYLVNKMVSPHGPRGDEDDGRKPIAVDAEGYRARRAETLTELAHKVADQARKTKRPVPVQPMSPGDRRVMHLALADAEGVTTRSEGEGASRRLIVVPDGYKGPMPRFERSGRGGRDDDE